ncbi:hypothetical protein QBC46DRAFT_414714 [Diplogelasinospora grovesii]|uniref:Uncharacterized protein n=1 Tax=Diplogelasinospora grovesii TaxID=303347 RepID=A0AAN6MUX9_9PEZI|nr:hypothetical protein QBC46DRAFT_414714 [Diplogelasinospora grovesii]
MAVIDHTKAPDSLENKAETPQYSEIYTGRQSAKDPPHHKLQSSCRVPIDLKLFCASRPTYLIDRFFATYMVDCATRPGHFDEEPETAKLEEPSDLLSAPRCCLFLRHSVVAFSPLSGIMASVGPPGQQMQSTAGGSARSSNKTQFQDNIQRLIKVWAAQEANRLEASGGTLANS